MAMHVGRSWSGNSLEDTCPCPKAPCGLAIMDSGVNFEKCPEHGWRSAKTIRQAHVEECCPGAA